MKKLILLLSIFSTTFSFSQSYSISAGVQMPLDYRFEEMIEQNSIFLQYFDDFYIETNNLVTSNRIQKYMPRPGFYVNVNHAFYLKPQLKINVGLGVNSLHFNYQSTSEIVSQELISEMVVPIEPTNNNTGFLNCDLFLNSFIDVGEPLVGQDHTVYYLSIPLSINYRINDLIGVSLGTGIRTPIHTSIYSENIRLNQETTNGSTVCEYELHRNEDNSGDGYKNLLWDLNAQMQFYLKDNLSLDLGASMTVTNTFHTFEEENFFQINKKHKPIYTSLGLSYYFGKKLKRDPQPSLQEPNL